MWSRVVEAMLGCWLVISPFVFRHPAAETSWWINDIAAGTLAILFGLLSFWKPTRFAHGLTLLLSCWLIGFAYRQGLGHASAAAQNNLLIGLLLLMFAVIPNQASGPPPSWEEARFGNEIDESMISRLS